MTPQELKDKVQILVDQGETEMILLLMSDGQTLKAARKYHQEKTIKDRREQLKIENNGVKPN